MYSKVLHPTQFITFAKKYLMNLNKFYIVILITTLLYSCNSKSDTVEEGNYAIKATITGLADNSKIVLKKQENERTIIIDSTFSENDRFEFKGNIESPAMFGIFIDSLQGGLFPLIESGTITITVHKDSLYKPVITGSSLNDELEKFKEGSERIVNKINDLFIQIQKARAENDLEKINDINNKMRAINDENTRYSLDYAKNNPNSFVSSVILHSLLRIPEIDINEIESTYSSFSVDVKKSEYSKNILRFLETMPISEKDSIN